MEALRQALRQVVAAEMAFDPAHDLAHLDRVWRNAQEIAASEPTSNPRFVLGAAYLHDLVNMPKDSPKRAQASQMSAKKSGPILEEIGFNAFEITDTQHAILAHSFSAGVTPETVEARILRDADRLDALGAVGIARSFMVAGGLARALSHPDDPFATDRALDDRQWSLDHWPLKLLRLPADMLTETGRKMAERRAAVMLRFLEELGAEFGEPLPESWREGII